MLVKDVRTTKVVTVGPDATVPEIAALLHDHRVSAIPMLGSNDAILAIASEGDLMLRPEIGPEGGRSLWLVLLSGGTPPEKFVKSHGREASDVMNKNVTLATVDMPLATVAGVLEEACVKRLPEVHDGRLVGIVSRADIDRGLASAGKPLSRKPHATDEDIWAQVLNTVEDLPWHGAFTSIIANHGVVHLWGVSESQEQRDAYRVAMEEIPGVLRVVDQCSQGDAWM